MDDGIVFLVKVAAFQGFVGVLLGSLITGVVTWWVTRTQIKASEKFSKVAHKQEWAKLLRNEIVLYLAAAEKLIFQQSDDSSLSNLHNFQHHFFSIQLFLNGNNENHQMLRKSMQQLHENSSRLYRIEGNKKQIDDYLESRALFTKYAQTLLNEELEVI